jgi:transposase
MGNILALSPAVQKQILRQARDRHFDADALFRLRLILAVASGRSRRCVAAVCSCAASTCIRAVERFERGGFEALQDQRCHNGPHKLSLAYLETLHAVLDFRADEFGWQRPTWTREALALTMAEQHFPIVAACTVGRALRQIRARRGRPKPSFR